MFENQGAAPGRAGPLCPSHQLISLSPAEAWDMRAAWSKRVTTLQRLSDTGLPPYTSPLRGPDTPAPFYARTDEGRRQSFPPEEEVIIKKKPGREASLSIRPSSVKSPAQVLMGSCCRRSSEVLISKFTPQCFFSWERGMCVGSCWRQTDLPGITSTENRELPALLSLAPSSVLTRTTEALSVLGGWRQLRRSPVPLGLPDTRSCTWLLRYCKAFTYLGSFSMKIFWNG